MKAENIDIALRPVSDPGGRIIRLDTCHDCGRVLHSGIFCSGCLAWSDHRPTPTNTPNRMGATMRQDAAETPGFNDPKPPDRTMRVWCGDCMMSHICTTDHGPDGHLGSAVCCPIKKLMHGSDSVRVSTADEGRRMASLGFITTDHGSTWRKPPRDHRPTPAVSPAVPGAAAGSMTGDSGAVRAVRGSTAPRSDYDEKGGK